MIVPLVLVLCLALAQCQHLGGWTEADVDDEAVIDAAWVGAQPVNLMSNAAFHYVPKKIFKAEKQVVAGIQYRLDVLYTESSCSKKDVC